ncbi:PMS1 protein homolog 1-like isoform X2 [Diprion similis]|uniref:PMS1 protein homolog 1-like isoform X2 n=1 Tax=Diprion similis TaxID=362088 RepID=UPI001EF7692C|nr:PMS1 protein homolog 1-like isoform X2 [Diprion similis]
MSIRALNCATVKLVTSTQIITSVSSVVKELVENSLDAGAKNIEINLTDDGLSLIEIRDDGCGISVTDVLNMAMPHCTSKILDFADLDSLTTYGFRGEALNAICRVAAEVRVTTKTIQDETARSYVLDNNGCIISRELSPPFVGTTVRVRKLFDHIPVRRQIISNVKKSKQDVKLVENILKGLSMAKPIVRMTYRVNNHLVFLKPSCDNIKEALGHFLGGKVVANLEWITHEDSEIISESVADHFGDKAPGRKRPIFLISITVAPNEVDVNLEPNKTSVLLKNQDIISKRIGTILANFYDIRDENTRPEFSEMNTSINGTPEYHDVTHNVIREMEVPVCKKSKLNNNKQRARDFIVDLNTDSDMKRKGSDKLFTNDGVGADVNSSVITDDIQGQKTSPADRDSINSLLKTFPEPILSDSDDESNVQKDFHVLKQPFLFKTGHAVRPIATEKQNSEFGQEIPRNYLEPNATTPPEIESNNMQKNIESITSDNYCETLSQLPIVDLGEDFDIAAVLEKPRLLLQPEMVSSPSKSSKDNNQANNSSGNSDSSLKLWSRGQIPGLRSPTHVSVYEDPKNTAKANSNGNQTTEQPISQTIYHIGFSKFSYEIRAQVLEENPGATLPMIGKILATRWKELSSEERGYYRGLALEEKKNSEAEKKKLKNNKLTQQEADKNKARLVQMLESMKKKSNKKGSLSERTTAVQEMNIQNIAKSFYTKPTMNTLDQTTLIGPITDEIWAVRSGVKICVLNSAEIMKDLDPKEYEESEKNTERTASILQSWLREKKTIMPNLHPIYNIGTSTV